MATVRAHDDAARLYRLFHRRGPDAAQLEPHRRVIPPVLVHIGELAGLIYKSDKWTPGRMHSYIHIMETPPRLAVAPSGRQLYLVGGNYRVTDRGIEG